MFSIVIVVVIVIVVIVVIAIVIVIVIGGALALFQLNTSKLSCLLYCSRSHVFCLPNPPARFVSSEPKFIQFSQRCPTRFVKVPTVFSKMPNV